MADNKTIIMIADSISTATDNAVQQPSDGTSQRTLTAVALGCALIGLTLCWFPIVGMAHALAAVILGVTAYRRNKGRAPLAASIAGAVATVAAVVLTIVELHSIEVVDTYSAAPWI